MADYTDHFVEDFRRSVSHPGQRVEANPGMLKEARELEEGVGIEHLAGAGVEVGRIEGWSPVVGTGKADGYLWRLRSRGTTVQLRVHQDLKLAQRAVEDLTEDEIAQAPLVWAGHIDGAETFGWTGFEGNVLSENEACALIAVLVEAWRAGR